MALGGLLNQTITYENPTAGRTEEGVALYAAAVSCPARFEQVNKTILSAQKEREPINGRVFIGPNETILQEARVTYAETLYRVLSIEKVVVGNGKLHHYELLVQLWSFQ